MQNCPFCDTTKIWQAGILYRDENIVATHSATINIPGYTIIYPLRHVTGFDELNKIEAEKILRLSQTIVKTLRDKKIPKVYLCSFGEIVEHFHLHILPRHEFLADLPQVKTQDKIDGAKLFSYVQQQFRVQKASELENPAILEMMAALTSACQCV